MSDESTQLDCGDRLDIYKDHAGEYRARLTARNHEIILPLEGHAAPSKVKRAMARLFRPLEEWMLREWNQCELESEVAAESLLFEAIELLHEVRDTTPCVLDHAGHCQSHGFKITDGEPAVCPQAEIKKLLRRVHKLGGPGVPVQTTDSK